MEIAKNKDKIELQKWQHELIEEVYQALDLWVAEAPQKTSFIARRILLFMRRKKIGRAHV